MRTAVRKTHASKYRHAACARVSNAYKYLCILVRPDGALLSRTPYPSSRGCCLLLLVADVSPFYFPASGQAVVSGVVPSSPRYTRGSNFYRAEGSAFPLLVDFRRMLLTRALASQFVHEKKYLRIYMSMHSGRLELTQLAYKQARG